MKKIIAGIVFAISLACTGSNKTSGPIQVPVPTSTQTYPGIFRKNAIVTSSAIRPMVANTATIGSVNMSEPRAGHSAVKLSDGKVLITGGYQSQNQAPSASAEIFDPATELFTIIDPMPIKKKSHASVLRNDGLVVILGGDTNTIIVFDPSKNTFGIIGALPTFSFYGNAYCIGNNQILCVGGGEIPFVLDQDFKTIPISNNISALNGCASIQIDGGDVILCGGTGITGEISKAIWYFSSSSKSWSSFGTMTVPRYGHTITDIGNFNFLIAGGINSATQERYMSTETLSGGVSVTSGNLIDTKAGMSSVNLQNGYTLHVGGADSSAHATNSQMIFDPVTHTSGYTGSMLENRVYFTMTALNNGKFLITGGNAKTANSVSSTAEIFDQDTGIFVTYKNASIPLGVSEQLAATSKVSGVVSWSCDIGTIDSNGLYTAPSTTNKTYAVVNAEIPGARKATIVIGLLKTLVFIDGSDTVSTLSVNNYSVKVNYYSDQSVTWSCTNGTITSDGIFTAPSTPGTTKIKAISIANSNFFSEIEVTVN